jgi:hypothetical protein
MIGDHFMKKYLVLPFLMLTSCVNLTFDSRQYDSLITVKEISEKSVEYCNDKSDSVESLRAIRQILNHEFLYAKYRADQEILQTSILRLIGIVDEAQKRYKEETPSVAYCELKFQTISAGTTTVISTIGKF